MRGTSKSAPADSARNDCPRLGLGKRFSTPSILLTSVSRVLDQKVLLLREAGFKESVFDTLRSNILLQDCMNT